MTECTLPKIFAPDAKPPPEHNKLISNYPANAYHADREAISQGSMGAIVYESPAHFIEKWAKPYVEIPLADQSPAMRLGTIAHHALLEPWVYGSYLIQPNLGDGRTKKGKEAKAEWIASLPPEWLDVTIDEETGKETKTANGKALILQPWEKLAVEAMTLNVLSHPWVRRMGIFDLPVLTEQTVFWVDPITGIQQRARLDIVAPKLNAVIDYKTTEIAHKLAFAKKVNENRYHFQGAHYVDAAKAAKESFTSAEDPAYVFIAAERNPPYAVGVYNLATRAIQTGEAVRRQALTTLRDCIAGNKWPAYGDRVEDIDLPAYAYSQQPTVEAEF